jgi:DNA invertase Pin-like site-specific DNA recombinase
MTMAVSQFERSLISERIKDAKRNLRRAGPVPGPDPAIRLRLGNVNATGWARELLEGPTEQQAISERTLREKGCALRAIAAR